MDPNRTPKELRKNLKAGCLETVSDSVRFRLLKATLDGSGSHSDGATRQGDFVPVI